MQASEGYDVSRVIYYTLIFSYFKSIIPFCFERGYN